MPEEKRVAGYSALPQYCNLNELGKAENCSHSGPESLVRLPLK